MRIIAALCLAIFSVSGALAQTTVSKGDRFGDWITHCAAETADPSNCAISQTLNAKEGGAFVADVGLAVRDTDAGKRVLLILLTPEGTALNIQPAYVVDENESQSALAWRACAQGRCRAATLLTPAAAAELQAGRRMIMGYQGFGAAEPVRVSISLNGVTAGLQALGYE